MYSSEVTVPAELNGRNDVRSRTKRIYTHTGDVKFKKSALDNAAYIKLELCG